MFLYLGSPADIKHSQSGQRSMLHYVNALSKRTLMRFILYSVSPADVEH